MQTQNFRDPMTSSGSAGGEPLDTARDQTSGDREGALARESAERIDRAARSAHDTVDRVSQRATELTQRATTEGERMMQATCGWIAAHPIQAVLGAFAAGYLWGRIRS